MRGIICAVVVIFASMASARDNGQWAQSDPATREWFRSQKNPTTKVPCCSEADGTYAEEDIRENEYWTRFGYRTWDSSGSAYREFTSEWMRVPPETVIHNPNRHGAPVVWWYFVDGKPGIRCFAPGAGI